jgi:hypothetical protein
MYVPAITEPGDTSLEALHGWLPVKIIFGPHHPLVAWRDVTGVEFDKPFFNQTLERLEAAQGETAVKLTAIDELLQMDRVSESLKPSGFVFHTSRCGSTLIANALRALSGTIVMAEAPPIDDVVWLLLTNRAKHEHQALLQVLLKAVVNVLGQRRLGTERHYFIKFTNWDILQIAAISRIWPDVPWVFSFRDPVEVIMSNMAKDAKWMRIESEPHGAATILGTPEQGLADMGREEFCARAVGKFCDAAADFASVRSHFVDYRHLTNDRLLDIVRFFGINPSPQDEAAVVDAARFYSKDPHRNRMFDPDTDSKQREVPDYIRVLANRWAIDGYHRALQVEAEQTRG